MIDPGLFHFLRPHWLFLILPVLLLLWVIRRRHDTERAWQRVVAPHLLSHLLVADDTRTGYWRPIHALALMWVLGCVALAGPAWEREPAPFGEETAAMVIILKVTPTMLARDVQPSRLQRAIHKIRDLLEKRPGGRTALVAYSGSAHLVMPMTSDARIIEQFAAELSPDVMPVEGDVVADAIELAKETLAASGQPGSIILLADEVAANQLDLLSMQYKNGDPATYILGMAGGAEAPVPLDGPSAAALDVVTMERAARNAGGSLVRLSADDADVARLARLAESSIISVAAGQGETWRDAGYYLLPFLALLALLGFRRGWMVRYQ